MIQKTFLALSDPTRREILKMLKKSDRTVSEISERFDVSPPAISRHLTVLRDAELISTHREGKFIRCSLNASTLEDAKDWLTELINGYE